MNVVRVPKSYLPEDVYFLVAHKDAVLMPYKIADAKVHEDPVGVSGALIEGRHYYDAYVLGAKCGGVYALVDEDCRSSAPTISQGKITAFGKVRYTLDGSDPRYSDSAKGLRCRHCADAGDRLQDPRILRAVRRVSVRGSGRLRQHRTIKAAAPRAGSGRAAAALRKFYVLTLASVPCASSVRAAEVSR